MSRVCRSHLVVVALLSLAAALPAAPIKKNPGKKPGMVKSVPPVVQSPAGGFGNSQQSQASQSTFSGVININGREVRTSDPAEFHRLMQQNQLNIPAFPPGVQSQSFQGVINQNGVEQQFSNQQAFEQAVKGLGQQLPQFPIK